MSTVVADTIEIMNVLPAEDQELLYSMAKKLIRAWDPDFTKLTSSEAEELKQIVKDMEDGEYVSEDEIDWD